MASPVGPPPAGSNPTRREAGVDGRLVRSIYLALMLVVASVVALWLLVRIQSLLVLVFVALLIATSLAGPVRAMERWGIPRAAAILLAFLLAAALVIGAIWFTLPPLIGQVSEAAESLPERFGQFEQLQDRFNELEREYPVLGELEARGVESIGGLADSISQLVISLPALFTLLVFVITSLMTLSFLMLMSWATIKPAMMRLIQPRHRGVIEYVLTSAGERLGAYVRAKVIISTIVGAWMYVTMLLLGSPIALLVSIVAAIFEIIPRIGPLVARAIIVLAVLPLGWRAVLIAFFSHMVIDNIKGSWLSPLIEGHQVEVHPLTAFIAVISGALLMGWMGALIAVPVAAVVQVVVEEIVIPWRLRQLGDLEAIPGMAERPPPEAPAANSE
jgi:predicted PurR-regulated permease PerM